MSRLKQMPFQNLLTFSIHVTGPSGRVLWSTEVVAWTHVPTRCRHVKLALVGRLSGYEATTIADLVFVWSRPMGSAWFWSLVLRSRKIKRWMVEHLLFIDSLCVSLVFIRMMTSSNGNIFRVTGHLCGEFTGRRWIPRTKASDAELWCFLWSAPE